jgi:adenosylmethionine-8-amino-7-oxononanoate aminotransferase
MSSFFSRNLKRVYPIIASGTGVFVKDTHGNIYLDGSSGAITANLGHGLNEINGAIEKQLSQIAFAHTSQFVSKPALDLAEKLITLAPTNFQNGGRAYFVSGGSEAIETAMKLARSYFVEQSKLTKSLFISRWNSYHGSTFGAMSVTGHPARRKPYISMLKEQPHINAAYAYRCLCNNQTSNSCQSEECTLARANELEQMILKQGPENVIAFIGEPIVGAALGAAVPGKNYWQRIREICNKYDVLLIADEVMTGLGRCGANFALDLWQVQADIIAVGKGLSSGYMPLGAVLASKKIVTIFEEGTGVFEHGFTYSGQPLACAAGLAAVNYTLKNNLIQQVAKREQEFFANLYELANKHEIIGDVRGRGFLAGLEFVKNKSTKEPFPIETKLNQLIAKQAFAFGLITYPGSAFIDGGLGDHIMIAPPFTISDSEIEELFKRLDKTLTQICNTFNVKTPASISH